MAAAHGAQLKTRGETIAVAESSTGGLISAALLAIPGASAYFLGGGVIYTRDARRALLGLSGDQATMRASTEDYALLLARTIRERFDTSWAIGESGATGPTGNGYGDAPGHVCIAVTGPIERAITIETADDNREANMWRFAEAAFELFASTLSDAEK
jgi:PncC family amidohydrolase